MTYKDYEALDFIKDDFFVKWVNDPDKETDLFWRKWIANNPEKKKEIEVALRFLEGIRFAHQYKLPEKDFASMHERILRFNKEEKYHRLDAGKNFFKRSRAMAAVIIVFILSVGAFVLGLKINNNTKEQEVASRFITKKTLRGTKRIITLPDGTKVKLNSASNIEYPDAFSSGVREVFLEGEAFFEVVRDTNRPFIVHCRDLNTQVLGTSFNVRSYPDDAGVKVALVTGEVKITSDTDLATSMFLKPEELAAYDPITKAIKKTKFEVNNEIGWKDGILSFNNDSLSQVFKELELWYDVEIKVDASISLEEVYKGEFKNETLENVLTGIGYASDFNFQIHGKQITIYPLKE